MKKRKKITMLLSVLGFMLLTFAGCGGNDYGFSAQNPVSITVWYYYSGALAEEFDEMVAEFNNTVGHDRGIVVYSESNSNIDELSEQLLASANKEVGAPEMPDIFHCYLDTAVALKDVVELVDLDKYIKPDEKARYVAPYVEEGTFAEDGKWHLFPVAKSTEVLMLNKTDWEKFAAETGTTTDSLSTWEGLASVAEVYYKWSGGKAFYGRDAFANYMLVGSAQLGAEIFTVTSDGVTITLDERATRKLWDNFYVPYVKGYYNQVGRFRSDDIKLGEIIAQVCSTSSAVYFPEEVHGADHVSYPIEYQVLPLPNFEGMEPYAVQQGANMAVIQSTESQEYASVEFLKWFTEKEQNLRFNLRSGYLPVTYEASEAGAITEYCVKNAPASVIRETIEIAIKQVSNSTLFVSVGFENGVEARNVLNTAMVNWAVSDREAIEQRIVHGEDREAVLSEYLSDAHFQEWYQETQILLGESNPERGR